MLFAIFAIIIGLASICFAVFYGGKPAAGECSNKNPWYGSLAALLFIVGFLFVFIGAIFAGLFAYPISF
jgi:hypothetical protein